MHPILTVKSNMILFRCTVSECIEQIGYGRYHWKVVATMGMMSAADSAEIWIIGLISRKSKMLLCVLWLK